MKRSETRETRQAQRELRKAHKKRQKELKKLSEQDKQVYIALLDPDNKAMQAIRHGGDEELQAMYRKDIWDSIRKKHSMVH